MLAGCAEQGPPGLEPPASEAVDWQRTFFAQVTPNDAGSLLFPGAWDVVLLHVPTNSTLVGIDAEIGVEFGEIEELGWTITCVFEGDGCGRGTQGRGLPPFNISAKDLEFPPGSQVRFAAFRNGTY